MAAAAGGKSSFLFVFPSLPEHLTPSLAVAQALAAEGHKVTYVGREAAKPSIEAAGAAFQSETDVCMELYKDRASDAGGPGPAEVLKKELGLEKLSSMEVGATLIPVLLELKLPGLVRYMTEARPAAVLFCTLHCEEAGWAARIVGIPSVGLLTLAGPGAVPLAYAHRLASDGMPTEEFLKRLNGSKIRRERYERINQQHKLDLPTQEKLLGKLEVARSSFVTLVTASAELQLELPADLAEAYRKDGVRFESTGPLLATRGDDAKDVVKKLDEKAEDLLAQVRKARTSGRKVILVSMGRTITGEVPGVGWESRSRGPDGKQSSLTNSEVCRAAWGAAFEALGKSRGFVGPLIVCSLGLQDAALGNLEVPANAVCMPSIPQVELLKAGVDVFVTLGGPSSFAEALAHGAPVVVCPAQGDHLVNAAKAEQLGVGVEVARPDPSAAGKGAAQQYQDQIVDAMQKILSNEKYAKTATDVARRLADMGGTPRVVQRLWDSIAGKADMLAPPAGHDPRSEKLYQRQKDAVLAKRMAKPVRWKLLPLA